METNIYKQSRQAAAALAKAAGLKPLDGVIVGCSTSEVIGKKIGSAGSMETAGELLRGLLDGLESSGAILYVQCCEHLNRSIVLPKSQMERLQYEEVCVLPQPHAGGSLATAYYEFLGEPCVVAGVQAKAGLDIGDTLIGMHLKRVAVPLRLPIESIGFAHLVAAYTRPPLIGGARASYPDPAIR